MDAEPDVNTEPPHAIQAALRRLPHEAMIELGVLVLAAGLGFGLTFKVAFSVAAACLRFAIPDIVTGFQVRRHDPDPVHGAACFYLFLALGMWKATRTSLMFVGLFLLVLASVNPNQALFDLFVGQCTLAMILTLFYLVWVFPLVWLGCRSARRLDAPPLFLPELTRLRRKSLVLEEGVATLYPRRGWQRLARVSTVSASLWSLGLWLGFSFVFVNRREFESAWVAILFGIYSLVMLIGVPVCWYVYLQVRFVDRQPASLRW